MPANKENLKEDSVKEIEPQLVGDIASTLMLNQMSMLNENVSKVAKEINTLTKLIHYFATSGKTEEEDNVMPEPPSPEEPD